MNHLQVNMSYIFTLSENDSILSATISPPITLDDDGTYVLGLTDFISYFTIPNVNKSNNRFHYKKEQKDAVQVVTLPEGSYEIQDINALINQLINAKEKHDTSTSTKKSDKYVNDLIVIKPNHNTMFCEIKSDKYVIDFTQIKSIGSLLGFDKKVLGKNETHISQHPINIINVNAIFIECNIVCNSFANGKSTHIIHMFYPTVPPGFKIVEHPTNVIYLPINTREIREITLKIVDQNGKLINFKKELITIRLHLKKLM